VHNNRRAGGMRWLRAMSQNGQHLDVVTERQHRDHRTIVPKDAGLYNEITFWEGSQHLCERRDSTEGSFRPDPNHLTPLCARHVARRWPRGGERQAGAGTPTFIDTRPGSGMDAL
jgi:hypothetical protein